MVKSAHGVNLLGSSEYRCLFSSVSFFCHQRLIQGISRPRRDRGSLAADQVRRPRPLVRAGPRRSPHPTMLNQKPEQQEKRHRYSAVLGDVSTSPTQALGPNVKLAPSRATEACQGTILNIAELTPYDSHPWVAAEGWAKEYWLKSERSTRTLSSVGMLNSSPRESGG